MDNQSKIEKDEVVKEKPVKKSKNIAVILAVIALALTVTGFALAELTAVFSAIVYVALSVTAQLENVGAIITLVLLPIVLILVMVGSLILVIIDATALASSIVALILNRKNQKYAVTVLGCVSAPISFLYLLSAFKSFVGTLLLGLLFLAIVAVYIVYIVIFLGIVAIFI